ncbi:hypothetical protein K488DRAFT_88951 [Vararia minispora EC-137]|uniref:Uncharacterized protein n=1 Tax=Vararia minispora EC-137 TaxID=1314806 RepID=A0ACB8QD66_9AGAM|nr:hypothetical protein K488DRAFT_88951 [Vararia minispora EC-137]
MPMWSFSTAMRELERTKLHDLPRIGDRPPRCLLPLPPAPSTSSDAGRPTHVYGIAVSEDLLADLAHATKPRTQMDGVAATYAGLALVRARTGAMGAFLAAGRPPRVPSLRDGSGGARSPDETEGVVPLVCVCSNTLSSYKRRPSQDVVDRLTQMLGGAPRWWEVYVPHKGERLEDIVCAVVA